MMNGLVFGLLLIALAAGYEMAVRHYWAETLSISDRLRNPEVRAQWFSHGRPVIVARLTASRIVIAVLAAAGAALVARAAIAAVM